MNWLQKIASPEEYLGTLGAPPETIQWIMSQPNSQFFINEYRKNPSVDVTSLQPPEKREFQPTRKELQRAQWYAEDNPMRKWVLVQLRKLRTKPHPLSSGLMDYDYSVSMNYFDIKTQEIDDWYRISNANEDMPNIDIASYTWDQAVAASNEWHSVAAGKGSGKLYEPTNPDLIIFNPPEWQGWSIQKVISENDLLVEGNKMSHCVGDYYSQVKKGNSEIYSLRDPQNQPHVTIEMDPGYNEIVQVMGNSNREPDDKYKEYIKQWLQEFQNQRPGLKLGVDDAFDFDFRYVENSEIDEEINRIVYQGNEYGLKVPLNELDIERLYESVISELTKNHYHGSDTRYVGHIGPVIAGVAWDSDKYRANLLGITNPDTAINKYRNLEPEERWKIFKRQSNNEGVGWLWEKSAKNDESFMGYFDFDSYLNLEDFETEEEYEKAMEEEFFEYEREVRNKSLPYALDDEITNTLAQLAREDPFLPEHAHFQKQESKVASVPSDFPDDLLGDMDLLHEEKEWRRAVSTPGFLVRHNEHNWTGKVIESRGDPANGGIVLVEHEMPSGLDKGFKVRRFYSATELSPIMKMTPPFKRYSNWLVRARSIQGVLY